MHLHVQMRFSCEKTVHCGPYTEIFATAPVPYSTQYLHAVLCAAVAPILEGLSGTLAVHDISELRHNRAAVVSEDTICICRLLHLFASAMACHEIMIRRVVPGGLTTCLHKLAGSNGL